MHDAQIKIQTKDSYASNKLKYADLLLHIFVKNSEQNPFKFEFKSSKNQQ